MSLRVRPEVSALSAANSITIDNIIFPGFTVRRAETTVELASGQSLAIAGLVRADQNITADKVPGLGDIPILGELFKSDTFQRQETELVIIVTPYLVRPATQLVAPTDGFVPANDADRYSKWTNYTPGLPPRAPAAKPKGTQLIGPGGFALD